MRALLAGALAVVLLSGCTSEEPAEQATPTSSAAPVPTGPLDESALIRTTLGLNDGSRTTDPTPDSPGDDAVQGRDLTATIVYPDIPGPMPIVVFSHGLGAQPEGYDALLDGWALEGWFVVAPSFPLTVDGSPEIFDDVVNQPADVSFVLDAMFELNEAEDEPFVGLLDVERVAVAGHSAGGITTLGLLNSCCLDDRIDAAVVLAGSPLYFGGEVAADAPALFVHGTDDEVLPLAEARAVFDGSAGPAAFLELAGASHSAPFYDEGNPHFPAVREATTDFLRWALEDDDDALVSLRAIGISEPAAQLTGDRLPQ